MLHFDWAPFYKEFAHKIASFKHNRSKLIEMVHEVFTEVGIPLPTLDKDNTIDDMDPFTVIGLFNRAMSDTSRMKIAKAFADRLQVKRDLPTGFDGVPVLNNQNATFYYFTDERKDTAIDDLWGLFESALAYAEQTSESNMNRFTRYFNRVINAKGNGIGKVSMGLYWIAPDTFLNLDSRNRWYIYKSGKLPDEFVATLPESKHKMDATTYLDISEKALTYLQSDKSDQNNVIELSYEAWRYYTQLRQEQKEKDEQKKRIPIQGTLTDEEVDTTHYWIYSAGSGSVMWEEFYDAGIMAIGWGDIGDLRKFASKEAMRKSMREKDPSLSHKHGAHATWQFANEMKIGDVIFVKRGLHHVIGRGVVTSDYYYDEKRHDEYKNIRNVDWTDKEEKPHPGKAVTKFLTDITRYTAYVEKLRALYETEEEDISGAENYPVYTEENFFRKVFMSKEDYYKLVRLLKIKKNVILQGPPGVGKTFVAKRLAYAMMGVQDIERVMMIQFHQSYSYEDFIMGYRPSAEGFELKTGAFYDFCKNAEIDSENDYFFIIDEINRGNLSKIFGELFVLIENNKRENSLRLLYSDEEFSIPKNVHIIGMMNTADRSLAMLDYALRRRFAFFEMTPGFDTEGFQNYSASLQNKKFDALIKTIKSLNQAIAEDESLGQSFCLGHSFFCNLTKEELEKDVLGSIVEYELIPLLKEYWFDEWDRVRSWSEQLRDAIR